MKGQWWEVERCRPSSPQADQVMLVTLINHAGKNERPSFVVFLAQGTAIPLEFLHVIGL